MSDEPIKFRCYRCGKLLGAPTRRAGAVVTCPQCRAEIQVPEPSAGDPTPPDLAFLGSEEVAVEPEFAATAIASPERAGDPVIPAIRYDATPFPTNSPSTPRAPDVVLAPAVVLAWSLLVLAAIPMTFTAGLLVGHFLWK
ncbi:hypothetical protein [Paludisphaera mucosa]|uniref:Uncharacterized protein n=1 Tax=Paludisphaera mucosa TaxID=3030827 RepID=A0ABT6F9Z6_9BACT|nr:hypothetical protein [Paludisphaera mucosa]MDG3004301.1 hypothetical protein [Paludisphaera mucosa]